MAEHPPMRAAMSTTHAQHMRTLTSLLSAEGGELGRSHSVPGEQGGHEKLQGSIISQPLALTHPQAIAPPRIQHAESEPLLHNIDPINTQPLDRAALKDFDPLAGFSPAVPSRHLPPVHTGVSPNVTARALNSTAASSTYQVGSDQTISSVNSYSSSALSSGTFTAISVSPVPGFTPGSTPGGATPQVLSPPQPVTSVQQPMDFFSASARSAIPTAGGSANASVSHQKPHSMSVEISAHSSKNETDVAAASVAKMTVSSPSVPLQTPVVHASPSSRSRGGVTFNDVEQTIHEDGRITNTVHERQTSTDSTASPIVHLEESTSPYPAFDRVAPQQPAVPSGLLSPSAPQPSTLRSRSVDVPQDEVSPQGQDSPLPPVVSALMAAQKMAGTTPGATLAMPVQSQQGRLIYLVGDASGAGKSSIAMGLLHLLLKRGYDPSDLAYIKPCTQCEDIQIVSKYCEQKGIQHQGLGPVIFYEGFTAEVIDGKAENVDVRRGRIQKAVNKIAEGKKWVVVDGVGYAAVGSVAGVSNAEVASLLNAPVLVVGRPGIGNAIDSMNFILAYFEKFHVHMVGACWNKLPPMHSYHSYEQCKHYVTKYFKETKHGIISTYGHIPLVEYKSAPIASASVSDPASPPSEELQCRLRPAKTDLQFTPVEERFVEDFLAAMEKEFNIELLLGDLNKYYQAHRVQLVSVV